MRAEPARAAANDNRRGDALSVEYVGANIARRYVHGPGVDEPLVWYEGSGLSDRRYLVADRQGSIIAANGAATTRHTYGPYGEPDAWAGPRFRYTGQAALPEVQLYHYKARVYDPVLGRFLQTDPVGYEDDLNLYMYVRNDPLNLSDPSGMQSGRHPLEDDPAPLRKDIPTGQPQPSDFAEPLNKLEATGVVLNSMSVGRDIQSITTTAGIMVAGASASAEIAERALGPAGTALAVGGESFRVAGEVRAGEDAGQAVAAAAGRTSTTLAAFGVGVGLAGGPNPAGMALGTAFGLAAELSGGSEAVGEGLRVGTGETAPVEFDCNLTLGGC